MDETELDLSKLLVTLSTDKPSSVVNETVEIMLTVTNTGNSNITLTFSDAQVADFEILTKEGETGIFVANWKSVCADDNKRNDTCWKNHVVTQPDVENSWKRELYDKRL